MSPLRVSCCVLALTLAILAAEVSCDGYPDVIESVAEDGDMKDRVKRQTIRGTFTSDTQQRFTLNVQGVNTGVILNEDNVTIVDVTVNQTVVYDESARSVMVIEDPVTINTYTGIDTFTFLDTNGDVAGGNAFSAADGPGTLFVQGSSAFFSKAVDFNAQIVRAIPSLPEIIRPPRPVEVLVTERVSGIIMNLVLNIDNMTAPDMNPTPRDDVIELTGSDAFILSDGQSIFQRPSMTSTELIIAGAGGIGEPFRDIARFSTLQPVTRAGVSGSEFMMFTRTNLLPRSVPGPGILRVGKLGGQNVAFFTGINSVNMQINSDLVNMQLEFRVMGSTAEIISRRGPSLGQRLVMLNGARSFSFPDATTVRLDGTAVSAFSGMNLLQRFDTGTTPTVSAFLGHQILQTMTAPETFDIPEGGATLFINMDDNEIFLYPSRNQIIGQGINGALEAAEITPAITTAQYSLTANPFGIATLRARVDGTVGDGVEVVQVAPGATIVDLGTGNFISYKGMAIEILNNNGMVEQTFTGVTPLTINAQGVEYLSADGNLTTTFGGPGRLYIDPEDLPGPRRAFFTRNSNVQNLITNFVNGLPEPRVDLVRNRTSGVVSFQSNRRNLFDLNGASALTAGSNQAGIYSNDRVSLVNAFDVPNNARAFYNAALGRVRVPDPNNPGSFLLDVPVGTGLWELQTDNMISVVTDLSNDRSFSFTNGIVYYGDGGVMVAATDTINDGVRRVLTDDGGIHTSSANIPSTTSQRLTVVDDKSIITYTGSAPTRLPRGGTYYTSSDGNSSIYISNVGFNNRVRTTFSQLNPPVSTYNRTTGTVTVTTTEGEFIGSLRPGITETRSIDRNGFITYAGGEISFDPAIRVPIGGISTLNVWDGLMNTMYDATSNITFAGPGIFWFEDGMAFYTTDPTTVRLVTQRINSVMNSFRPPILSRTQRSFREKFRTVRGGFPQTIDVYEGANVMLNCTVLAGNPPSAVEFQRRFFNQTTSMFQFETIMDGDGGAQITQTGNSAVLTISSIRRNDSFFVYNDTGVFRCIASNFAGSDTLTTTINVLPPEPPAIVTGFLPPLSFRRNSSERLITITAGDNNMLAFNDFRTFTIRGPPAAGNAPDIFDDGLTIVRTLHIGCKGEGRPKANIRWYQLVQDSQSSDLSMIMMSDIINDTSLDVNITEPREGRSVLSINLPFVTEECQRYICEAENLGGRSLGGVDICTRHFTCEETIVTGTCSGTCGIGVQPRRYSTCLQFNRTNLGGGSIDYDLLPQGLFPLSPQLCGFGRPPCPRISYQYIVESSTPCSVTCGTGSIMRTIVCQQVSVTNVVTTATVNDSFCAGQYRPSDVLTCSDNPPCPQWRAGAYGECSVTCGTGGMRTRDTFCVQARHNETTFELILDENNATVFVEVDRDLCLNTTEPSTTIPCDDRIPCPIRWRPLVWASCPTSIFDPMCGCQTRGVVCEEFFTNDYGWPGVTVNDSVCEELGLPRPHTVRNCQGFVCEFGEWVPGRANSTCSVTCGSGGTIVQTVNCRDRDNGTILEDGYCDSTQRPNEVVPCPLRLEFLTSINCPGRCDYEPGYCSVIRLFGCTNPSFAQLVQSCCKSCPKQATPPTIPVTEVIETNVTAPAMG